jgi:predicted O-methyltransferase YrrM
MEHVKRDNIFKPILRNEIIIKCVFVILLIFFLSVKLKFIYFQESDYKVYEDSFYLDKYETYIYNNIKEKLLNAKCSYMWDNQREFLNGAIRKFRPKKVLEIGPWEGGSSIIILNALKDIPGSKLYSVDLYDKDLIGSCVPLHFKELTQNWKLFKGNTIAKVIESIGNNIDLVLLDSVHLEPCEILQFLVVLPFLKEEAVVIFHDIANQITKSGPPGTRREWASYIIFNILKGKKYLPSGKGFLLKDIGAVKLEKNQKRYVYDYFRALGGQWQYFPKEIYIKITRDLIAAYYNRKCINIFDEAVKFNRKFVKNNILANTYFNFNSD